MNNQKQPSLKALSEIDRSTVAQTVLKGRAVSDPGLAFAAVQSAQKAKRAMVWLGVCFTVSGAGFGTLIPIAIAGETSWSIVLFTTGLGALMAAGCIWEFAKLDAAEVANRAILDQQDVPDTANATNLQRLASVVTASFMALVVSNLVDIVLVRITPQFNDDWIEFSDAIRLIAAIALWVAATALIYRSLLAQYRKSRS